jgi:transposase
MVFEHRGEYGSEWEAIGSIAEKIGCASETLRKWVRQTEVDTGRRGASGPPQAHRSPSRWNTGGGNSPV